MRLVSTSFETYFKVLVLMRDGSVQKYVNTSKTLNLCKHVYNMSVYLLQKLSKLSTFK